MVEPKKIVGTSMHVCVCVCSAAHAVSVATGKAGVVCNGKVCARPFPFARAIILRIEIY